MRKLAFATLFLGLAACSDTAQEPAAEETAIAYPGVPEELKQAIADAGQAIDGSTIALFADYVDAPPYDDVTVARDVAYGEDERQVLDVYIANDASDGEAHRVLLFVHGGGFTGGSKSGGFYPDNITAWAARNGMVGVNVEYRLAPENSWPAGRDDLASAIEWVRANITQYGGDPDDIVLFGHSAGANHVADYVTHKDLQGSEAAAIEGAVLLSPYYAPQAGPPEYAAEAGEAADHPYYGSDPELQTESAAIARMGASDVPLFIGYAQYDPQFMIDFARKVESELCADGAEGACPQVLYLPDHNHLTEGAAIGSVDQSLTGPLLEWMKGL